MTDNPSNFGARWVAKNLDEVDREVARLASMCQVRILDPGIIERVLNKDESVCGTRNTLAFEKLRNVLIMHYQARDQAVSAIGETATAEVIADIIANLGKRLGKGLGGDSPA